MRQFISSPQARLLSILLLTAAVILMVIIVVRLSLTEMQESLRLVHLGPPQRTYRVGSERVEVQLNIEKLDPLAAEVTGKAHVTISPELETGSGQDEQQVRKRVQPSWKKIQEMKEVVLFFSHRTSSNTLQTQGGSNRRIALERHPLFAAKIGTGDFSWSLTRLRPEFLYPFDSYLLYVNHSLGMPSGEITYTSEIDDLQLRLQTPSLLMHVNRIGTTGNADDTHQILLQRALLLRLMAALLAFMSIVLLLHLATVKNIDQLLWQSLGWFVALWAIRGILLSNVSSFPVLIDYVTLGLYAGISAITVVRWRIHQSKPAPPTRECPFCYSQVDGRATRCPHCTSTLAA